MMDGMDEGPDLLAEDHSKKSEMVDLNTDTSLEVDISDALSERNKVKFTVHTKTTLSEFQQPEFSVVRQHEEFIWLHDRYEGVRGLRWHCDPPGSSSARL
ncbi:Sorting nexin-6 [Lamellibrachia satsuma]|nr:Sorting nexin-6 [Lamellibrachia satsuma]